MRAVVFAYHDVGDRCLRALVSSKWDVPLVITHRRDPEEPPWFANVADSATELGIPVLAPTRPSLAGLSRTIWELKPDFIFSFYYRDLIGNALLETARRGALNMHGSLLPRFRGRAPVNWAIIRGERETGVTLHHMVERADAGDIVDQLAVPILIDDNARQLFAKITVAAEIVLSRNLVALENDTAPRRPQDLAQGEYCGRRTPEDGRIDWRAPALDIHNLVRGVAPPFPGAFSDINGTRWWFYRTRFLTGVTIGAALPRLLGRDGRVWIAAADGHVLEVHSLGIGGEAVDLRAFARELERNPVVLR